MSVGHTPPPTRYTDLPPLPVTAADTVVDALRLVERGSSPAPMSHDAPPARTPGAPHAMGDWSSPDNALPVEGELPSSDGSSSAGGFSGGLAHIAAAEFASPPSLALAGERTAAVAPPAPKRAAAEAALSEVGAAAVGAAAVFDFFVGLGARARAPSAAPDGWCRFRTAEGGRPPREGGSGGGPLLGAPPLAAPPPTATATAAATAAAAASVTGGTPERIRRLTASLLARHSAATRMARR